MPIGCVRVIKPVIVLLFALSFAAPAAAAKIAVNSVAALAEAMRTAKAGDVIAIAPGTYTLTEAIAAARQGAKAKPITVRATALGAVRLKSSAVELFKLQAGYWVFENLIIQGVCRRHKYCQHAFYIVGAAEGTVIRNNHLRDFNAAIKGNGIVIAAKQRFPSRVLIEGNAFFNAAPRKTARPVTPINVVGGSHWVIRRNFFADFGKVEGNRMSYAAFLKGNSSHGLMERNLVIC